MIKGTAVIEFGSGSVASAGGVLEGTGIGVLCMRSVAPGLIGRGIRREEDVEKTKTDPEVMAYFTNIESIDSFINTLTSLRTIMQEVREEVHDD